MNAGNKAGLLSIVGSLFFLAFIFAKPLGIPEPWDVACAFVGLVFMYSFFRAVKKLKADPNFERLPTLDLAARKKRFWLVSIAVVFASFAALLLAPYMVDNFQPWLYFVMVPVQILALGTIVFVLRRKLIGSAEVQK